jgi:5-methylcytosine-specific restriction endonuclease McrA
MTQTKEQKRECRLRYYKKNREKLVDNVKKYNAEHKEERSAYNKEYYEKNKEKAMGYVRKYKERMGDKILEMHRTWIAQNPSMTAIYNQHRRSRKAGLKHTLTMKEWEETVEYFNGECAYCGSVEKLCQDHVVTVTKGGEYVFGNIVLSCQHCNLVKHTKDLSDWYPKYEHYSEAREKRILEFIGQCQKQNYSFEKG